ncbi:MAG: GTP diphosphokinase [Gallionellales bacterium 35-53-114]|jgi:GTP pyrophosphokinase|nr:MAG: GTP diphosphokinase [Gallionellales bacterium 35-53-114]OYZ63542.1 MAG: GTP diphosphokinase [Gallionellales bacterium 24-53-125]OZB10848.1 MAG: GTP diphosphokinase [Gallionellales bacterium 39-52-133]HQS58977.1 GTP diphosphokinase [Gallionellaceae bacterium]HQS75638.1 GTP diphosphokinase [Gallionellaceae bacterium]
MVSVTHKFTPSSAQAGPNIQAWIDSLSKSFTPQELAKIRHACEFVEPLYAEQMELTGIPLLQHALGTAAILAGMNMDYETLVAAILHAVPELLPNWMEKVATGFNANIVMLVLGISRMEEIQDFSETSGLHKAEKSKGDQAQQIESLRKMLLAMVEDIRVVLIKLAERTQTMRNLSGASEENQQLIAREIRGIFAPLANRLGVWQVKWELEDLALRYLEPELYKKIARLLDERRVDREQYIADVLAQLKLELGKAGIKAEVTGRSKHINSIVNKMKRKQVDFSELYDVRAVRILVEDVKDCYTALGLVHNLWQPIPSEFDDYIAHPKSNDYRSLHTAVIGPRNLALEVQIRTFEMHQHSELGVAAHWRYKEGGKSDAKFDEKIAWLRQILEWKEDVSDSGDLVEQFKSELFQDKVYVLTPQGKVIDLPRGSTPVDFAYTLHTDLGHRTRGAKVDGSIVPLNYKLQNGQRVEILAAKQGTPSRDWLNPALDYLHSPRARAKVRHWFKHQHYDENVSQGRAQLDKELHRLGVTSVNQEKIAQRLNFNKLEDLLAAIGRGDVTPRHIAGAIQEELPAKTEAASKPVMTRAATTPALASGILIEGVGNLMTKMARCCKPAPPDDIVGYVTRDRGVTIHRKDCSAIVRMPEDRRDRVLAAQWGGKKDAKFSVDIEVEARDRQGLLRDISELFSREKINVTKVNTLSRHNQANMQFSIEIADLEQLSKLLAQLHQVPNVVSARRR